MGRGLLKATRLIEEAPKSGTTIDTMFVFWDENEIKRSDPETDPDFEAII